MKISATEEYGLRCILHVAQHFAADQPVTAQEVGAAEGISVPYAQKLLRQLSKADLIESRRGKGGGYVLARHPERISVLDVVRALDADFEAADVCAKHKGEHENCAHAENCSIRPVWSFIEDLVSQTLNRLSLSTLLEGNDAIARQLELPRSGADLHCPVADLGLKN